MIIMMTRNESLHLIDNRTNEEKEIPSTNSDQKMERVEKILWLIFRVLLIAVTLILIKRNWTKISYSLGIERPVKFDEMTVTDGFHHIQVDTGETWDISYETGRMRGFSGLVRHTSADQINHFSIITYDILVTKGDFADANLVQTSVSDHHFSWYAPNLANPDGEIHLLHTVPMNDAVNQQLGSLREGDTVIINGYDIYRIEGYDANGNYIGYWEDSGCNTTLVTEVRVIK